MQLRLLVKRGVLSDSDSLLSESAFEEAESGKEKVEQNAESIHLTSLPSAYGKVLLSVMETCISRAAVCNDACLRVYCLGRRVWHALCNAPASAFYAVHECRVCSGCWTLCNPRRTELGVSVAAGHCSTYLVER